MEAKKVFLGGTCGDSNWRNVLIPMLEIEYFNPVVEDWTEECMAEEIEQRKTCDFVLYVISPFMQGVYSIAEVVDDSNKRPEKTVFCVLKNERVGMNFSTFTDGEMKSLDAVKKMVKENKATVCESLEEIAKYLNGSK
jgi:hypothetical protein